MGTLDTIILSNQPATAVSIPPSVLESLAARFRPAGLFLLLVNPDGSVAYHDPDAGAFFCGYALPMLREPQLAGTGARNGVGVWKLPGLIVSSSPYVERREIHGIIVVAARSTDFELEEDVLRACSRLNLDASWLAQQAAELPGYGEEAIQRQGRLLLGSLRDQLLLSGMTREIDALSGQLANTYEELSLIYQISSGMKVNRQAADFFRQACLDVLEVIDMRAMGFALLGEAAQWPPPAVYGKTSLPPELVGRLAAELTSVLVERKNALLIDDLAADANFSWLAPFASTLLAVPLQRQDQVLGCFFGLDKHEGAFDSVDCKLLNSIANESAIYLENVMLFDDVHGLMMGLLHSLTSAVDAKDAYTCGHSERVALISRHLAEQINLSTHDIEQIYMAGLLHDVGKIGVPEAVLQKTGRLTTEEFDQMKRHPQIGARILQDIKQVKHILPGVLYHHERFDGKGYPTGLAGTNIPLMGRIICLADCFDAMTSNRTYRKALPLELALIEIRRCAGTQFDPTLAETFLRIGPDRLRELLREQEKSSRKLRELQETIRTPNLA